MSNPLLPLIQAALAVGFSPVKTALATAESDPQAAASTLINLAAAEVGNIPAVEDSVITEGAKLGLTLIADLEAKVASMGTPAPTPAAAPTPAPVESPTPAPSPSPTPGATS